MTALQKSKLNPGLIKSDDSLNQMSRQLKQDPHNKQRTMKYPF